MNFARYCNELVTKPEAQRAAVARFAKAEGYALVAEFTEVETGKGADALDRRPQLAAALAVGKAGNECHVARQPVE